MEKSTRFTQIGKVTEEKGYLDYDKVFKMDVKYFKDKAVFIQKIRKVNNEKVAIIGEIEFMACNDVSCIPAFSDIKIDL